MDSDRRRCPIGTLLLALAILVPLTEVVGKQVSPCPSGWSVYDKEVPTTCLWVSASRKHFSDANDDCHQKNAHLMTMETDIKYATFKEMAETKIKGLWIPLIKTTRGFEWYSKDGHIPVNSLPDALKNFRLWYSTDHSNNKGGLIYRHENNLYRWDQLRTLPYYVCEKRANCTKGWFGLECDKQCHCYAQECNPSDLEVTCPYGCEIGWMGKDCSKRKEDAKIRYFCVNSLDQGRFAHVRIYTKGVNYENIHAVDGNGRWVSWCNSTSIVMDNPLSIMTIKIFVNNDTRHEMENEGCAGKVSKKGVYEWQIRVQEKAGIVSRNDQEVHVECDFNGGDPFHIQGEAEITRERGFKRSDVMRPVEFLDETQETVQMSVVDPSDGKPLFGYRIGSAVVLKIYFAVEEGDVATGVIPYSCFASTPDLTKRIQFLDDNGCPSTNFPISAFSKNGTKSLVTKPFNLFGFEGAEEVDFHCSYVLCFDNEPCPEGCHNYEVTKKNYSRRRRSATVSGFKLEDNQDARRPAKSVARSPSLRRLEEMLDSGDE